MDTMLSHEMCRGLYHAGWPQHLRGNGILLANDDDPEEDFTYARPSLEQMLDWLRERETTYQHHKDISEAVALTVLHVLKREKEAASA